MPKEGEKFPVTPEWKRDRLAALKKHGVSRADLARHLEVTRGAISQLFSTAKTSTLVPAIDEFVESIGSRTMSDKEKNQLNAFLKLLADPQGAEPDFELLKREYLKMLPDVRESVMRSLVLEVRESLEEMHKIEVAALDLDVRKRRAAVRSRLATSHLKILAATIDQLDSDT